MYSKSRVVAACPNISPVTLSIQLVSGERLIGEFHPEGKSFVNLVMLLGLMFKF